MVYSGNRGMSFENLINLSNDMYRTKQIAHVEKRELPIKITYREGQNIRGRLLSASLVDYSGHLKYGRKIEFDAKSTREDRWPLKDLPDHQLSYLRECHEKYSVISFLLLEYRSHRRTFLLPFPILWDFVQRGEAGARGTRSIHISEAAERAVEVSFSTRAPLDYLAAVESIWVQS